MSATNWNTTAQEPTNGEQGLNQAAKNQTVQKESWMLAVILVVVIGIPGARAIWQVLTGF